MLGGTTGWVNGDVAISDSAVSFVLGDGLRFTDAAGNLTGSTADRFIYFSDVEAGPSDGTLADTGFPTNFVTNTSVATETGPEGNNGFTWVADPNTYNGVSDGVLAPEPSTMVLLGSGALALGLARRRRRIN
jgi:hypothetical protein